MTSRQYAVCDTDYKEVFSLTEERALRRSRIPLDERTLPDYTRGEEVFNMVSHIVGGAFGVFALILCIWFSLLHRNPAGALSGLVYTVSMILVYTISSVYHGLKPNSPKKVRAKKIMQILDHCDINFLIAGTYTPIAVGMRDAYPKTAWCSLALVWAVALLGTTFTAIDFHKFAAISYTCYFVAGWGTLVSMYAVWHAYSPAFVILIFAGGVVYTSGMIFFSLQKKHRYCHSVFHLFILGGSALHFIPIFTYCM